jgi:hypothetical protein
VFVLVGCVSTGILMVCAGGLEESFKIVFSGVVVGFNGCWWFLPVKHFLFVTVIAVVHLLQIKLKFVLISDSDVGSDKGALIIIKLLPEGDEVLVSHPFIGVGIFHCFLCLDVMRTPAAVEMAKELEWGDVSVCRKAMLELGVVLFFEGIA